MLFEPLLSARGPRLRCSQAANFDAPCCALAFHSPSGRDNLSSVLPCVCDLRQPWLAHPDRFLAGTVSFECPRLRGRYLTFTSHGSSSLALRLVGCSSALQSAAAFKAVVDSVCEEERQSSGDYVCPQPGPTVHSVSDGDIRLIFLDVDGPLAPWVDGKTHDWRPSDCLDDPAYAPRTECLLRIIARVEAAEPSVAVRVVVTSTWRTRPEQYRWLQHELGRRSVQVIGFTDIVEFWPELPRDSVSLVERFIEIHQCFSTKRIAEAIRDHGNGLEVSFKDFSFLGVGNVVGWIAIDDLPLDFAHLQPFAQGSHLQCAESSGCRYLIGSWDASTSDGALNWGGRHWASPASRFPVFAAAYDRFRSQHFVQVSGTIGIDEVAVELSVRKLLTPGSENAADVISDCCGPLLSWLDGGKLKPPIGDVLAWAMRTAK